MSIGYAGGGFLHPGSVGFTVDEFLTQLYNDELSDLFIGNRHNREESRAKLLPLINSGMLEAYAKYKIKLATTQLMVVAEQKAYILTETDLLSIVRVINSYGRELTTAEVQIVGGSLYFPCPKLVELQVEYKVAPAKLSTELPDMEVVLELPVMLVSWLRAYVAGRYLASGKTEAQVAKSVDFMNQAAAQDQLFINTNTTGEFVPAQSSKLSIKGFP